jgi:SAM-dependent methyltransferase
LTRQHFYELAAHLKRRFPVSPGAPLPLKVVDIASNDGILLRAWREMGVSALGVEPAENLCRLAWADGLETLNEFFTRETVDKIGPESAHIVTAVNVVAHVPELKEFAENVRRLLRPDGVFVVEVQYFRDTVEKLSFDNIYFEHVFYFTLTSLERVLANAGLYVFAAERVDTHGGSLRAYANTGELNWGGPNPLRIRNEEKKVRLDQVGTYQEFAKSVEKAGRTLRELLLALKRDGKRIAGYGAAAKATTLTNYCRIGPETVSYIVDDSPLKVGRFTPGTHIPIVSREWLEHEPPDHLLVLAWNYLESIRAATSSLGCTYIHPIKGIV